MSYIAIMRTKTNQHGADIVAKYMEFETQAEAQAHVDNFIDTYPDAFVVEKPTDIPMPNWRIENGVIVDKKQAELTAEAVEEDARIDAEVEKLEASPKNFQALIEWVAQQTGSTRGDIVSFMKTYRKNNK